MLKFALIGCGSIGKRHAEHINKFGELVAACDVDVTKAQKVVSENGGTAYGNIDELLENEKNLDIISVCTPNALHAEHTIRSLRAGFNVLCEKPMAIRVEDCHEMIKEAEIANKRLFIVKQNRFNPPVVAVKNILEEGRLGRILSLQLNCYWNRGVEYYRDSWRGKRKLAGGTLFTQFSHFIDLIYWMIGDVKSVKSLVNNANHHSVIEFEDQGVAILEFHNGVIGSLHFTVNAYRKNMEGSLTIFGEKGTVKIGGQYLNELEYQCIDDYKVADLSASRPPNLYDNYQGSMSNHDHVYANIVQVLNGTGTIATDGFEGLKTVEIINKIYTAAEIKAVAEFY